MLLKISRYEYYIGDTRYGRYEYRNVKDWRENSSDRVFKSDIITSKTMMLKRNFHGWAVGYLQKTKSYHFKNKMHGRYKLYAGDPYRYS